MPRGLLQRSTLEGGSSVTHKLLRSLVLPLLLLCALPALASTWYVRPDGGTRYTAANKTDGQCDGTADAAYPGSGVNQHCAFNDVRFFWQDGSYATGTGDPNHPFPAYGWIGQGGDTYLIRGSIADGVSYRIGYNTDGTTANYCTSKTGVVECFGIAGDPGASGMPQPPNGTASQHTRILGANYGNCHAQTARTRLQGGYAAGNVIEMGTAAYVDLQCLDITDGSDCGLATNTKVCSHDTPVSDFANTGIGWNRLSNHDILTDIRIHGLASSGMGGSTGDGVEMHYIDILGNAGAGWNGDQLDGTTGTGHLLVQNYSIIGNGCAELFPVTADAFPYHDCTDQSSGGYGDGFGTATAAAPAPGWQVTFDQGVVAYNTQDGLDGLHLTGIGSSLAITRTLAYGNVGNQIKNGGSSPTVENNIIVGNPYAMANAIPGFPAPDASFVGDIVTGSPIISNVRSLSGTPLVNMPFSTPAFPYLTAVQSLSGNTITMTQNATVTGTGVSFVNRFNTRLSTFGRGGDAGLIVSVSHGSTTHVRHNTFISNELIMTQVICDSTAGPCDTSALLDYRDNIEAGGLNAGRNVNIAGLYLAVDDSSYTDAASCNAAPNHFWQTDGFVGCQGDPTASPGSLRDHNAVLTVKEGCPANNETNALCGSPGLNTEVMPAYGYPDLSIASTASRAYHAGVQLAGLTSDYNGFPYAAPPSVGALEYGPVFTVATPTPVVTPTVPVLLPTGNVRRNTRR